jgi:hypothetical protein
MILMLAGMLAAGASGGQVYLISSLGPPHVIVVDGSADDWTGALSYVAKDQLFVGFVNDREDLFICLTKETGEKLPGAAMAGLTVWLDPRGGSKKTLGVRLAKAEGIPEGGAQVGEDIEILGPNGDVLRRLSPQEAAEEGIEVKSGSSGG